MKSTRRPWFRLQQTTRRLLLLLALFLPACLIGAWLAAELLIVRSEVTAPEAIVIMSGSSTYLERTAWASHLYREGRAPMVILTDDGVIGGWDSKQQRNPFYYELAAGRLEQQGVPSDHIKVVPVVVSGTYGESLAIREFAISHNLRSFLIVTSGYHSRRALWSMRHAFVGSGIEVGIDSAPPGWQTPSPWWWWSRRWGWKLVAGEYLKLLYYWTKY
jgi:uncharacterized SAM-binding protein YcdF (DUF218 family)